MNHLLTLLRMNISLIPGTTITLHIIDAHTGTLSIRHDIMAHTHLGSVFVYFRHPRLVSQCVPTSHAFSLLAVSHCIAVLLCQLPIQALSDNLKLKYQIKHLKRAVMEKA